MEDQDGMMMCLMLFPGITKGKHNFLSVKKNI